MATLLPDPLQFPPGPCESTPQVATQTRGIRFKGKFDKRAGILLLGQTKSSISLDLADAKEEASKEEAKEEEEQGKDEKENYISCLPAWSSS